MPPVLEDKGIAGAGVHEFLTDHGIHGGIPHVKDGTTVERGNLDGGMQRRGGGTAYHDGNPEPRAFHGFRHVAHLVERGRYQTAEAYKVGFFADGRLHDFFGWNHHAEINDLPVVADQYDGHDVFADVMHIAFHRGNNNLSVLERRDLLRRSGVLHIGIEEFDGFLHGAGCLHHLRQEHLAFAEEFAHMVHAVHQRTGDDGQGRSVCRDGCRNVFLHVGGIAVREGFLQFFGQRKALTRVGSGLRLTGLCLVFVSGGIFDEPFGGILPAAENNILEQFTQLRLYAVILHLGRRIHDGHAHPLSDGMIQEDGVHGFAQVIVAAERETEVAQSAAHAGTRQVLADPGRCLDKVQPVTVVFLHSRGNGQDIGVKDDILGRELNFFCQQAVGTLRDFNLPVVARGLSLFVKTHHDHSGSHPADFTGVVQEFLLPFLERDTVDDAFALHALQSGGNDFPSRGINHDGNPGDGRIGHQQIQECRHLPHAV